MTALNTTYAPTPTGSVVNQMDFAGHESTLPRTKIYHGMDIAVEYGSNHYRIGRIQSWAPQARTRQAIHKYELSSATFGRPVDLIPGRSEGYSISMSRVEVWGQEIEKVFGLVDSTTLFRDLMDMRWPVTLYEYLYRGDGDAKLYSLWQYPQAWITSYGESEYSAEGDGVILSNLELMHLPRVLLQYHPELVSVNN
jgi:hypothetical protein